MYNKFLLCRCWLPLLLVSCAAQREVDTSPDLATLWTNSSSEYHAASTQVYRAASLALPSFLADKSWTAIPYQTGADDLPTAIIMDIDQTVVNGVDFQIGSEPPFTIEKFDGWNESHIASPVPGVTDFVRQARTAGVRVFFLTNRPCRTTADDTCANKPITVQDLNEAGIPATDADVSLVGERPGWSSEKKIRRDYIAENHRVIMLFGDDLGDFIPCVRRSPLAPCTTDSTIDSRLALTNEHEAYWGAGWYILPNPMYGSWTTVE